MVLLELLWPGQLSRVRVKLGIWGGSGWGVGVKLVRWLWRAGVQDNDMALFEMLYESMKVLEVDTATCVIAAKLFFTFHSGKCVDQRASIRLYGRRYLPCTAEVGGI
jgi:hypothetical protein